MRVIRLRWFGVQESLAQKLETKYLARAIKGEVPFLVLVLLELLEPLGDQICKFLLCLLRGNQKGDTIGVKGIQRQLEAWVAASKSIAPVPEPRKLHWTGWPFCQNPWHRPCLFGRFSGLECWRAAMASTSEDKAEQKRKSLMVRK